MPKYVGRVVQKTERMNKFGELECTVKLVLTQDDFSDLSDLLDAECDVEIVRKAAGE